MDFGIGDIPGTNPLQILRNNCSLVCGGKKLYADFWLSSINQQTTNVGKDVEKMESSCTVGWMQTGAATVESSMEFPQKIKNGTAL